MKITIKKARKVPPPLRSTAPVRPPRTTSAPDERAQRYVWAPDDLVLESAKR